MFCFRRNNIDSQIQRYMRAHLEGIMRKPMEECNYRENTVEDWNRFCACDRKVNGNLFQMNTDLSGLEKWVRAQVRSTLHSILILNFANQSCWFEPKNIVKAAYVPAGIIIGDDLNTSYEMDQSCLSNPNTSFQVTKDSLEITSLAEGGRLHINLITYLAKCHRTTGEEVNLSSPIKLNITFIISQQSSALTVSDFTMEVSPSFESQGLPPLMLTLHNYIKANPIPGQPVSSRFSGFNCFRRSRRAIGPMAATGRTPGNFSMNNDGDDSQI